MYQNEFKEHYKYDAELNVVNYNPYTSFSLLSTVIATIIFF